MSYRYRNENTGEVVESEEPQKRLEWLANWSRLDDGEGEENTPDDSGTVSSGTLEQPSVRDSKADWVAYAHSVAQDSEEEDRIDDLTKEQLIETYGGSS